tara:strand:+ start:379 stop:513 length:135 start_codon:yes stop_codon:yes gene_type:complete
MNKLEKIKLAYKVVERMKLLPFLDEEVYSVLSSLDLVRQEDIEN